MKKEHFDELRENPSEVLDHTQGKTTLKTTNVPIPEPPKVLQTNENPRESSGISGQA